MECPSCHKITNTNQINNKYFIGKNSKGIPFFKCEKCGNLFYLNEVAETVHLIHRQERGKRFVPITWGILYWIISFIIFWFLGNNIITWLIGGFFLWLGWSSIRIGIWGSQKLIDEMTLDADIPSSERSRREWRKINKFE